MGRGVGFDAGGVEDLRGQVAAEEAPVGSVGGGADAVLVAAGDLAGTVVGPGGSFFWWEMLKMMVLITAEMHREMRIDYDEQGFHLSLSLSLMISLSLSLLEYIMQIFYHINLQSQQS